MREEVDKMVDDEIASRSEMGKMLAEKFPELRGLSYPEFLSLCPLELDFITSNEMFEALKEK